MHLCDTSMPQTQVILLHTEVINQAEIAQSSVNNLSMCVYHRITEQNHRIPSKSWLEKDTTHDLMLITDVYAWLEAHHKLLSPALSAGHFIRELGPEDQ